MADVTYISRILVDDEGVVHLELDPQMIELLGWTPDDDLEWDIVGQMAVVRKLNS